MNIKLLTTSILAGSLLAATSHTAFAQTAEEKGMAIFTRK